jgi:hypothetical protein
MSAVISISTRRRYGVARTCRMWDVSRSSLYRGRQEAAPAAPRRRPGPEGPMPDAGLVEAIRQALADSPFHGPKAIARSGRGCAMPACARRRSGCAA